MPNTDSPKDYDVGPFWGESYTVKKSRRYRLRNKKGIEKTLTIEPGTKIASINMRGVRPGFTDDPALDTARRNVIEGKQFLRPFIKVLSRMRGVRYLKGTTNRQMANAAVKHFGFHEVVPDGKRNDNRVAVIASKRTLISRLRRAQRR